MNKKGDHKLKIKHQKSKFKNKKRERITKRTGSHNLGINESHFTTKEVNKQLESLKSPKLN